MLIAKVPEPLARGNEPFDGFSQFQKLVVARIAAVGDRDAHLEAAGPLHKTFQELLPAGQVAVALEALGHQHALQFRQRRTGRAHFERQQGLFQCQCGNRLRADRGADQDPRIDHDPSIEAH